MEAERKDYVESAKAEAKM